MGKRAMWMSHAPISARSWGAAIWGRDSWDSQREVGEWADAPIPSFTWSLNGGFSVLGSVRLPRRLGEIGETGEPAVEADLGLGHMIEVAIVDAEATTPLVIWRGYIEGYAVDAGPDSEEVSEIAIIPLSVRLKDSFFVGPQTFTDTDPADMMRWFVDHGYLPGFAWDASSEATGLAFTQTFEKQDIGAIFDFCRLLAGEDWSYVLTRDNTVLFRQRPDAAEHILTIGQEVSHVQFLKDASRRKTRVYVYGSGVSACATAPEHDPANPLDMTVVEDKVTNQAVADALAETLLETYRPVEFRATATVIDSNGPTASAPLGYDLEALRPGDTVQVVNPQNVGQIPKWGEAAWGEDYWDGSPSQMSMQVLQIASIKYDFDRAELELSSRQPSQIASVSELAEKLQKHLLGTVT